MPAVGIQGSFSAGGVIGGGQAGYNFQAGRWVYGLEADLGGLDLSGPAGTAGCS